MSFATSEVVIASSRFEASSAKWSRKIEPAASIVEAFFRFAP